MEATRAEVPALIRATPTSSARVIWLDARAARDTGTNRMNLMPGSLRSLRRTGAGRRCHAALPILIGAPGMEVLVSKCFLIQKIRLQYGTPARASWQSPQPGRGIASPDPPAEALRPPPPGALPRCRP